MQTKQQNLQLALKELEKKLNDIHKGMYPKKILQDLGRAGAFEAFFTNGADGLEKAIDSIYQVARICGNSGFLAWCQNALCWYLLNSANPNKELFAKVSSGEVLGGTGLSNPIKSFAGIESIALKAKQESDGFILNGTLPWVSNIEYGHYFGAIAKIENSDEFVMGLIECDKTKMTLKENVHFIGLEGSATKSCVLKDYKLENKDIITNPWSKYSKRIMPGFVLLQGGLALGLIDNALYQIQAESNSKGGINAYLPFDLDSAKSQRDDLALQAKNLAKTPYDESSEFFNKILKLKFDLANLALQVAQANMLATGTKGYLLDSKASKTWIESNFVAIVTPSTKHIAKLLKA